MPAKDQTAALCIGLVTCSLLGALFALSQPGCSAKRCAFDERSPEKPVSSIECPSGEVCYQGECRRACEPGNEQSMPCSSDDDCGESARPHCVASTILSSSFCSSCEAAETCIPLPSIGICQEVNDQPRPEDPMPTPLQPPPLPLDGGAIDGFVFTRDAEAAPIATAEITHVGQVIVRQVVDFTSGTRTEYPVVSIDFKDVRTATVVTTATTSDSTGQCEIVRATRYSAAGRPADLGAVRIATHTNSPPAVAQNISATFDPTMERYLVLPNPLPQPAINLSDARGASRLISLFGAARPGVTRAWPEPDLAYHIPFTLTPDGATNTLLAQPITVATPPQDLRFGWMPLMLSNVIPGEKVSVDIVGGIYVLHCQEIEGIQQSRSEIVIPSSLMSRFLQKEMITPGSNVERTVVFERVFESELSIPGTSLAGPVDDAGVATDGGQTVIRGDLIISHSFKGTMRF